MFVMQIILGLTVIGGIVLEISIRKFFILLQYTTVSLPALSAAGLAICSGDILLRCPSNDESTLKSAEAG